MSAVGAVIPRQPLAGSIRAAYAACVLLFGWAVAQFYAPTTGFSSLISIGDVPFRPIVSQLKDTPHYVYDGSSGYDGAYYVQLALNPTLENPELTRAIDNLQYRARRMLFSWVAWAAGLGRPDWVVQAHALLNVASWFGLAWVLLRWFPATCWSNFFRWFGVLFSHGLCMSVRNALVDGPALLLMALALAAWEKGHEKQATWWLALVGLGRESSMLAAAAFAPGNWRDWPAWRRFARVATLATIPLLVWVLYLRWKFGVPNESGLNNFTLPLTGFGEKWGVTIANLKDGMFDPTLCWVTLADLLALTVQAWFFVWRRNGLNPWWRVGITFVGLMCFISTPVWEGFPGAAGRVLLPMMLAFNVLVPHGRRWLPVLLAGNLTVLAAVTEFSPPREFFTLNAPGNLGSKLQVEVMGQWFNTETAGDLRWRWSSGKSALLIQNSSGRPVALTCTGRAAPAMDDRKLRISAGEAMAWSGDLAMQPLEFQFGVTVPPGKTELWFTTDRPGHPIGVDSRDMAFKIYNVAISARLVAAKP